MVPPNLNFWSIWRKESLESQQKHALRNSSLRTLLFSNDIFNPAYNRKMLMRKRRPFLTEFVLFMNSCFIQYKATLIENVNVAQEINSFCQKWLVFCHFQINFANFEVSVISVTVHDNIKIVCISLEVYTYFSPTILNCRFFWNFLNFKETCINQLVVQMI